MKMVKRIGDAGGRSANVTMTFDKFKTKARGGKKTFNFGKYE